VSASLHAMNTPYEHICVYLSLSLSLSGILQTQSRDGVIIETEAGTLSMSLLINGTTTPPPTTTHQCGVH